MQHYILKGKEVVPTTLEEWAKFFESENNDKRIALSSGVDKDGVVVSVSTVFIGIDEDELFETLVFGGDHDEEMERCSTFNEAVLQHQRMIDRLTLTEVKHKEVFKGEIDE